MPGVLTLPAAALAAALALLVTTSHGSRLHTQEESNTTLYRSPPAGSALLEVDQKPPTLYCNQVAEFVDCAAAKPKMLHSGKSSQAWLVQEKGTGRLMVLKVFYKRMTDGSAKYLTGADLVAPDPKLSKKLAEWKRECQFAKELAEGNPDYKGKGRERFVKCFGHNLESGPRDTVPLHLRLEYCGRDLFDVLKGLTDVNRIGTHGGMTLDFIGQVTKQLLEGLNFLHSFGATYIHHDLKLDNVAVEMVKVPGKGRVPRVTIIDLGAMVKFERSHPTRACVWTTSTPGYAPWEWERKLYSFCERFNFHPMHPDKFDMFSLGSMLVTLLSGESLARTVLRTHEVLHGKDRAPPVWDDKEREHLNFVHVWNTVKNPDFLQSMVKIYADLVSRNVFAALTKQRPQVGVSFLEKAFRSLAVAPEDRPSPAELLQHKYMRGIQTPSKPSGGQLGQRPVELECERFAEFVDCAAKRERLYVGQFAQVWVVQERRSRRRMLLKILHGSGEDGSIEYLTGADLAAPDEVLADIVEEWKTDCKFAKELAEGNPGYKGKGRERFARCYGHNLDSGSRDTVPLHVRFEYCGLGLFDARSGITLASIGQVAKQLLEALDFLHSFEATYIHHDLTIDSIAVEMVEVPGEGKVPRVTILNLGSMIKFNKRGSDHHAACVWTPSTPGFAPYEWGHQLDSSCREFNFDPKHPDKFDMFSVGSVLMTLLSGQSLADTVSMMHRFLHGKKGALPVWLDADETELNFDHVWNTVNDPQFLAKMMATHTDVNVFGEASRRIFMGLSWDSVAESFLKKVFTLLAKDPKYRPSAEELLEHDHMRYIYTPRKQRFGQV